GRARDYAQRARTVINDPTHPVGKAIRDGVVATRRKRQELESRQAANESAGTAPVAENHNPDA
ncbi:MAG: hypothetical protein M3Z13_02805, partial [Candidatus Dormibacteraeota bacterium]|nr:hypothetical protein [Candidatus Dormibacteraeota bacterium]